MGNEESRPQKRSQDVPRTEVNRLLNEEKKRYEQKLKEIEQRARAEAEAAAAARLTSPPAKTSPAPRNIAQRNIDTNVTRNIDQMLGQQLQEMSTIIYGREPSTSETLHAGPSSGPSNLSLERTRSPYSHTSKELNELKKPTQNIYPNLTRDVQRPSTAGQNYPRNVPDDFVFVAKQAARNQHNSPQSPLTELSPPSNPQRSRTPVHNPRFAPSAPPDTSPARQNPTPKNKAKPRRSPNDDDDLNCRLCGNRYGVIIFQCEKGHSCCKKCKDRGCPCVLCSSIITDIRNFTLEAYISERKVSCPNQKDGCRLLLRMADLDAHVKECPFSELDCPLLKCRWKGQIEDLARHFDDAHPENRQANVDTEMNLLNISDAATVTHLIDLGTFYFLIYIKVDPSQNKIFMVAQLLGTSVSASKWHYEIHVYNKRQPRRKFTGSDVCLSQTIPLEEICRDYNCVVIPQSYAKTFANDGVLNYKFYVKKDAEMTLNSVDGVFSRRGRGGGRGRGRGRGRWQANAS